MTEEAEAAVIASLERIERDYEPGSPAARLVRGQIMAIQKEARRRNRPPEGKAASLARKLERMALTLPVELTAGEVFEACAILRNVERYPDRVSELLEANNRYQQEARDARAEVREFEVEYDRLLDAAKAVCLAAWTDRHSRLHGHATVEALDKVISPQAEAEPAATEQKAPPPPPWPCGGENNANAKREGWLAFFTGRARGDCPFPPAMPALWDAFGIGWDAAQARQRGTGSRG